MENPWKTVSLSDYEDHMKLDSVRQLGTLNTMMYDQLYRYPVRTVVILGIAGGNGLNHIDRDRLDKVYGVDVNREYLEECVKRYPELEGIFYPIQADLMLDYRRLPNTELLIADLLVEYIGYPAFLDAISQTRAHYVSCIIQINRTAAYISDSPYAQAFECLNEVHHQMDEEELTENMRSLDYGFIYKQVMPLPNGKELVRLDYQSGRGQM